MYERDADGGLWCSRSSTEGETCRNPLNRPCRISYCEDGAREQNESHDSADDDVRKTNATP